METKFMEELYHRIANIVNEMIPESWNKFYLYAEMDENISRIFFYYYPEGKALPVYSLDIEKMFDVDEEQLSELDNELDDCLTELREEFKRNKQEAWTNLTFILSSTGDFKIEYGYEDLSESDLYENQVIWEYKYLGLRTEGERANEIIENYIQSLNDNEQNN